MKYRLPPLNSLRLFEASARLHSFKSAADELALTPSAVSHGVMSLEEWLGVPLFDRTPKGLVLSRAGERFYPAVCQALELLSRSSAEINRWGDGDQLIVTAAPTFAARWLLPRLREFRANNPIIKVLLDTATTHSDVANGEVDLAIRLGRGEWPGLFAELLMDQLLVPVCNPRLASQMEQLDLIDRATLIHVDTASVDWEAWVRLTGRPDIDVSKGLHFDTLEMAFQAAAEGLGVALGRKPLVDPELSSGRLVEIWNAPVPSDMGYWLVCSEKNERRKPVRLFREWIKAEIKRPGLLDASLVHREGDLDRALPGDADG
ncbi:LysR family glycine cleavage system transcriptional activator [Bradyrhizobium sp. USDA 4461]